MVNTVDCPQCKGITAIVCIRRQLAVGSIAAVKFQDFPTCATGCDYGRSIQEVHPEIVALIRIAKKGRPKAKSFKKTKVVRIKEIIA